MMGTKPKLGCHRTPDHRIKAARRITRMAVAAAQLLPPSISYRSQMPPVRDQGSEGTCVAFACVDGIKEYEERLENDDTTLSPRYAYQGAKKIDGIPGEGTTIDALMQVLKDNGVCPEACWPYIAGVVEPPVCKDIDAQAAPYEIDDAWLITSDPLDLQAIKESLVANGPFVGAVEVYSSFFNGPNGVIPMPSASDVDEGGHAICFVGYDDTQGWLIFKNSWGNGWGDNGYGYLPYTVAQKTMYEAWSCRDKLGENPTPPPMPSLWEKIVAFFSGLWRWMTGRGVAKPSTQEKVESPSSPQIYGCPECGMEYKRMGDHWEPQCHC